MSAATSNSFQPLTIITKSSILDVATVLDPPQGDVLYEEKKGCFFKI